MDTVVIEFGQNEKKTLNITHGTRPKHVNDIYELPNIQAATFSGYIPWWMIREMIPLGLKKITVPEKHEPICGVAIENAKYKGVVVEYEPTVY